jgi:RNA polymerase sigma-70 factor (ECF subfamily)
MDPLGERLAGYHLFHAARGELLRRLGRGAEALEADRRALVLTDNPAEQRLLQERIDAAEA